LRCGGASPPAPTRSAETRIGHRRIKIERVYRHYLTAWRLGSEAHSHANANLCLADGLGKRRVFPQKTLPAFKRLVLRKPPSPSGHVTDETPVNRGKDRNIITRNTGTTSLPVNNGVTTHNRYIVISYRIVGYFGIFLVCQLVEFVDISISDEDISTI
jgi:hypothetical protein